MQNDSELDTTIDEWQAEMDYMEKGDPGKTARELAEELGNIPKSTMQCRLEKLVKAGRCIKGTGKRIGVGGVYLVSVYQLKKKEKASK